MASKSRDGLARPHAAEKTCCAALICKFEGICILKRSKVEPFLDHRGLARFNYSVQRGQVQTAGISGRQDVYSCIPAPGKKAVSMGWGSGGQALLSITLWLFLSSFVLLKVGPLAGPIFPAVLCMG